MPNTYTEVLSADTDQYGCLTNPEHLNLIYKKKKNRAETFVAASSLIHDILLRPTRINLVLSFLNDKKSITDYRLKTNECRSAHFTS